MCSPNWVNVYSTRKMGSHTIHRKNYTIHRIMNRDDVTPAATMTMQKATFNCQWPLLAHNLMVNGNGSSCIWFTSRNHYNPK